MKKVFLYFVRLIMGYLEDREIPVEDCEDKSEVIRLSYGGSWSDPMKRAVRRSACLGIPESVRLVACA